MWWLYPLLIFAFFGCCYVVSLGLVVGLYVCARAASNRDRRREIKWMTIRLLRDEENR